MTLSTRLPWLALLVLIWGPSLAGEEKVSLLIPTAQCEKCDEAITESLFLAATTPGKFDLKTKRIPVGFNPSRITIHQIMQAVADTHKLHGKAYDPGLLVEVTDLKKNLSKLRSVSRKLKGVKKLQPIDVKKNELVVLLAPLSKKFKAEDYVTLAKLRATFKDAGLKQKGLETEVDKKTTAKAAKNPGGRKVVRKDAKPKSTLPKTTVVPRFQILAFASGRIYLVDNEAKPRLKKFVKPGDRFGDFTVKEIDSKSGQYLVL